MRARRLLFDAGNTRLKWAVVEGGHWQAQGSAHYSDLSALTPHLTQDVACYIASVAQARQVAQIMALLAPYSITPVELATPIRFDGVINTYRNPQQLGVDRWMGLVAARQRSEVATLVVSAGTAMTVDALSAEGLFLGGLIVPGLAMMQRALHTDTARVGAGEGRVERFPRATADAVQSGMVAALCGAIHRQAAHLAEAAGTQPHCILTGGDAERLAPYLDFAVEQVPALVLEGMEYVTRESKLK